MDRIWDYIILDAMPSADNLAGLACGDIDGDGIPEIIVEGEGKGALIWYRPLTFEKGIIKKDTNYSVALLLEDIDNDGKLELLAGEQSNKKDGYNDALVWYKNQEDPKNSWTRKIIDKAMGGYAHDALFIDIDGDSERELLAVACYSEKPAIYLYKKKRNLNEEWSRFTVAEGFALEGLGAADLNNDGKIEIICGPEMFIQNQNSPYGKWGRLKYAPDIREMCRTSIIDINNDNFLDIVLVESEFIDGRLSWFENRTSLKENKWVEHIIDSGLYFAHSLNSWINKKTKNIHIFVGEMTQGGWDIPINYNSRLIEYISSDNGKSWDRSLIYEGEGTREATFCDVDLDGELEIIGEDWGKYYFNPKVQIWKQRKNKSIIREYKHKFIDRDKPDTAINILTADIDGDNLNDIVCGRWWYKNPTWERYEIPGIFQIISAFDIDHDGIIELIAYKSDISGSGTENKISISWLKPIDPLNNKWVEYLISTGLKDKPGGAVVAPLAPNGKLSLIVCYESASLGLPYFPEVFEIPLNPKEHPWKKKVLNELFYGKEPIPCDINGDGNLDLVMGGNWLENLGDGNFKLHNIVEKFTAGCVCIADINNDGMPDVIIGEDIVDFENKITPYSRLAWFENPGNNNNFNWKMNIISTLRCPHSLGIADLDNDGEMEVICGEHDPFFPYRNKCRLLVFKKAEEKGRAWKSYTIDNRFEHYNGAKPLLLSNNKIGIISHGKEEKAYVHLWEI